MDFANTRLSLGRSIWSYSKVQALYGRLVRNRPFQMRRIDLSKKPRLNAGCGPNVREDFVNLDYAWRPGIDLCWDLYKPLPLADASVEGVYIHHCLEHLSYEGCGFALREFRRVLKPGATLRVVVPDGEYFIDVYQENRGAEALPELGTLTGHTPMAALNSVARDHGHLFLYDEVTMRKQLAEAGFADIQRTSFRQGRDPALLLDDPAYERGSLYMEASYGKTVVRR